MRYVEIFEGISSIVYHATEIYRLMKILQLNKFLLTPSIGTESDQEHNGKKMFFLSTTRSKVGSYHYPIHQYSDGKCLLVLDGQKLMQDGFSGGPVDYWGGGALSKDNNEMEDRIISMKSEIPNALKYIKEIHIYMNTHKEKKDERLETMIRMLRKVLIDCKTKGTPVFVYDSIPAFNLLQKDKVDKNIDFKVQPESPDKWGQRKPTNYFAPYMELLKKSNESQLSSEGKRYLNKFRYYQRDAIIGMKNDIHNHKTDANRDNLMKLLKAMQQLGISSVQEFYDYVNNKWKELE